MYKEIFVVLLDINLLIYDDLRLDIFAISITKSIALFSAENVVSTIFSLVNLCLHELSASKA